MEAKSGLQSRWGCPGQSFKSFKDAKESKNWEIKMLYDGGKHTFREFIKVYTCGSGRKESFYIHQFGDHVGHGQAAPYACGK